MTKASPFYDSTSVQALAMILVALLAVLVAIWAARNVRLPKRRIYYGISEIIPLLTPHSAMKSGLEVRHEGMLLTLPRLVTIDIFLRGRQDIASDDYDSSQPLQVDIGTPIITILDTTSKPDTSPMPRIVAADSVLAIGPSLIHCGQAIKISVLVDAGDVAISCQNPLKNVKIQQRRPEDPELQVLLLGPHNLFVIGALGAVAALMIAQLSKEPLSWIPFIIALPLMILALVGAIWTFWTLLKKPIDAKRAAIQIARMNRRK